MFFVVAGAATSCALLLMLGLDIKIDADFTARAFRSGCNVLFASALFTLAYGVWHRATIQRPVERILEYCSRVREGDFSARVERPHMRPIKNELDVIADDLDAMAQELSSVETLHTNFVSSVSHEMKTPVAQISNYATLLRNPNLSEDERIELAEGTARTARRLSGLVTNVLRLSRLENNQFLPRPEEFDLAEQLHDCLLSFEQEWEKKDIEIRVDVPDVLLINIDSAKPPPKEWE